MAKTRKKAAGKPTKLAPKRETKKPATRPASVPTKKRTKKLKAGTSGSGPRKL